MNKTTVVAFLLLISPHIYCSPLKDSIQQIESAWATIYYQHDTSNHEVKYQSLISQTKALRVKFPQAIEPQIWQAILLSTNAAYEPPFTALASLNKAKELLEDAIKRKPETLEGAALVALGTLYYMTPSWPISFGDSQMAEQLLIKGVQINPKGIDSNYFYADFLLTQNRIEEAEKYLKNASNAPIRTEQVFADTQLQENAKSALANTQKRKLNYAKNKFLSLFSSAKLDQKQEPAQK